MIDKCNNCRFWESDDRLQGICIRHAPSPVVRELVSDERPWAVWPLTAHIDSCGEFDFKPMRGRPR